MKKPLKFLIFIILTIIGIHDPCYPDQSKGSRAAMAHEAINNNYITGSGSNTVINDLCQPEMDVNSNIIDFGEVTENESAIIDIAITNIGCADLQITNIKIDGNDANQFSQANNCSTLSRLAQCNIAVTFAPTYDKVMSTRMIITSNDPTAPNFEIIIGSRGMMTPGCSISTSANSCCSIVLISLLTIILIIKSRKTKASYALLSY